VLHRPWRAFAALILTQLIVAGILVGSARGAEQPAARDVARPSIGWIVQKAAHGAVDQAIATFTFVAEAHKAEAAARHAAHIPSRTRGNTGMGSGSCPSGIGTARGYMNGHPYGGDLPPCCVMRRESGGNPTAYNPTAISPSRPWDHATGIWQIITSTWAKFKGFLNAMDAPVEVQNEKARLVWAGGAGWSNWKPRCW
jgi:hypothetical protein